MVRDNMTGESRGFGFVIMSAEDEVDEVSLSVANVFQHFALPSGYFTCLIFLMAFPEYISILLTLREIW